MVSDGRRWRYDHAPELFGLALGESLFADATVAVWKAGLLVRSSDGLINPTDHLPPTLAGLKLFGDGNASLRGLQRSSIFDVVSKGLNG